MLAALARSFGYKAKQVRFTDWKIVRGDTVLATQVAMRCGKDKSKVGVVEKVYRHSNQVLVKDVNIVPTTQKTKHLSKDEAMTPGKVKKEFPVHVSKVALIDPETK